MSDQVTNGDIYGALMALRGDLGRLEGKVDGHGAVLTGQKEDHEELSAKVQVLQLAQAKQRGFVAAVSVLGAMLGAAVDYLTRNR